MVVAGFDFGNSSGYIAIARDGGIEVLTNDYSLHATPSCVTFGPKNRLMGLGARQQLNVNFKNSAINFKHLIGRNASDNIAHTFMDYMPCEVVQLPEDKIGLKVEYLREAHVFSPVQIAACFLSKLKQITEQATGSAINECVIAVPYFVAPNERVDFLAAAKISGLEFNVKIISDQTAIGTAYGIYRGSNLPPQDQPPKIVAFVDAGHSCIQASIMAFNERKVAILGAAHDLSVGGLFFDACIREHFHGLFITKYSIDAKTNPRAWQRLLDECEKLRKQMSANSTAIPIAIECFMDGIDVAGNMKRSDFEELADPLFKKVTLVLQELLNKTPDIKLEDITEIELIGGCSRIPKIKQMVADFFKRDPMTTMNLDDAIARGCALQAALLSPTVIMKEFIVQDIYETEEVKLTRDISSDIKTEKDMVYVDLTEKKKADARNTLEEYCFKVQNQVKNDQSEKYTQEDKDKILDKTDEVLSWLDEEEDASREDFVKRHKELTAIFNSVNEKTIVSEKASVPEKSVLEKSSASEKASVSENEK